MKKGITCAVAFFLCNVVYANVADVSGWYFGLGAGGTQAVSHSKTVTTSNINAINLIIIRAFEGRGAAEGFEGELITGYTKVVNQKYLVGWEGTVGFHHFNVKNKNAMAAVSGGVFTTDLSMESTLKTSDPFVGLSLKPGFFLSPYTFFYGLVGTRIARFKVTSEGTHSQFIGFPISSAVSKEQDFTRAGLVLGLGMEAFVTDKMTLGLNCQYVDYGKLSSKNAISLFNGLEGILTLFNQNRLSTHSLLLRFNYYVL